jgi:hypothetical protein
MISTRRENSDGKKPRTIIKSFKPLTGSNSGNSNISNLARTTGPLNLSKFLSTTGGGVGNRK